MFFFFFCHGIISDHEENPPTTTVQNGRKQRVLHFHPDGYGDLFAGFAFWQICKGLTDWVFFRSKCRFEQVP
jgi:hypothetical protein